ncbi:MAG: IS66 family insertion sequence element accessory protein TnpB [Desulfobacteraceae bacterium]|nr:IS66 family insertion sequence element accessory protein TnpB [Desulfobacteraceae bacterium]
MSKSRKEKNQVRQKFWVSHIKRWSESDISQVEYCRQQDLIPHRFTYWKTKLSKRNLPVEFVQVSPGSINIEQSDLKMNIGQELQIEIPNDFSQAALERVLTTLKVL